MKEIDKQNFTNYMEVKSFGDIFPKKGTNIRTPYEHQKKAMEALDKMNQESSYSTLVVLPTGGGKTYTASMWLLKNAIDKKKKILWIAHRQMLLDQAAESFQSLLIKKLFLIFLLSALELFLVHQVMTGQVIFVLVIIC